jgi:hypothetical protein
MGVVPLCFRYQKVNIQIFSLTRLYMYYGVLTCFGPYLDNHQASV